MAGNGNVVEVDGLQKWFPLRSGLLATMLGRAQQRYLRAVDGVSFGLAAGEVLGLAGESGSGKSTTGMTAVRLYDPTGGAIRFEGREVSALRGAELREFRRRAQIIFQDPYGSLNPKFTIAATVAEPLAIHKIGAGERERRERVAVALEAAGLLPPAEFMDKYPHQLSGGQRQRVAIARAMVLDPRFVVADEPVSMLDVSIRASVLNVLKSLSQKRGLAILYISHDLSTIKYICQRTAIMYLGRIVEMGPTAAVIDRPHHPYAQALMSAIPVPDPTHRRRRLDLSGEIPDPIDLPPGCRFAPRCARASARCRDEEPPLRALEAGHLVACHLS